MADVRDNTTAITNRLKSVEQVIGSCGAFSVKLMKLFGRHSAVKTPLDNEPRGGDMSQIYCRETE